MSKYKSILNVITHVAYGVIVVFSAVHEVVQKLLSQ